MSTQKRKPRVVPMGDGSEENAEFGYVVQWCDDRDQAQRLASRVEYDGLVGSGALEATDEGLIAVTGLRAREPGWYRWNVCHPSACHAGVQHQPGHLDTAAGPGPGVWRGVEVAR